MLGSCLWGAHWWFAPYGRGPFGSAQCTRCMGILDPATGRALWPWAPEMFGAARRVPL